MISKMKHDNDEQLMIEWIQRQINVSSSSWTREHVDKTLEFLTNSSMKSLFIAIEEDVDVNIDQSGEDGETESKSEGLNVNLAVSLDAPPSPAPGRSDVFYFVRSEGEALSINNIDQMLISGKTSMKQTAASVLRVMEEEFYPYIFLSREWSHSSRQELLGLYHRFMASLTESANENEHCGKTRLYLPFKRDRCVDLNSQDLYHDRDVIKQLEAVAIHWIRQIKEVLNSHAHNIALDHQGPMEELKFWVSRAEDLTGIMEQLNCNEVKKVLSILKKAKSKYAGPVEALTGTIKQGSDAAANCVRFLEILQEPCDQLSVLKPKDIPSIMPKFMNCLRLIHSLSSNYNTHERIADLIRRVSSEIIRHCTSQISLGDIFYGNINEAIQILQDCIDCAQEWKSLYNRTAITVNQRVNKQSSSKWEVDDMSIFAEMDAFIQRCDDLMDVCHGREQFVGLLEGTCDHSSVNYTPTFRWTNGPEVENSMLVVRNGFIVQIDRLNELNYCVLDARESRWHSDYNTYKVAIQDLDTMMINAINRALEQIKVVDAAAEMLEVFRRVTHRPAIRHCIENRSVELHALFQKKCQRVRREFDDYHRNPPLRMNESGFAGSALWAKSRSKFVEKGWDAVQKVTRKVSKYDDNLEVSCSEIMSALYIYQNQKYSDWLDSIKALGSDSLQERLNVPLLRKKLEGKNQYFDLIVSNFDPEVNFILTESHFWDKLHDDKFVAPNEILGVYHQREVLRVLREKVMILVRAYTDYQHDLKGTSMLYLDHLKILEKKLRPGLFKIRWSTRPNVIDRFVQAVVTLIHDFHRQAKQFHLSMNRIEKESERIASINLIHVDRNISYEELFFELKQAEGREKGSNDIVESYGIINEEIKNMYTQFEGGSDEVQREWAAHVAMIDNMILTSLLRCIKTSLRTFAQVILGQHQPVDSQSIFTTDIKLLNRSIACRPSLISITNSVNKIAKETVGIAKTVPRLSVGKALSTISKGSFYDIISSDEAVLNLIVQIMNGISVCISEIRNKIVKWEKYKALWHMDKESYLRRYKKKSELVSYHDDIQHFSDQQAMIDQVKPATTIKCVQIDFSLLKDELSLKAESFRKGLVELLRESSVDKIDALYNFINASCRDLSRPIKTLEDLNQCIELLSDLKEKAIDVQEEFDPLSAAHDTLQKFDPAHSGCLGMERFMDLIPAHRALLKCIEEAEVSIKSAKVTLKTTHQGVNPNHIQVK